MAFGAWRPTGDSLHRPPTCPHSERRIWSSWSMSLTAWVVPRQAPNSMTRCPVRALELSGCPPPSAPLQLRGCF
eukprot:5191575-Pyramimonas_sp.AAC.1